MRLFAYLPPSVFVSHDDGTGDAWHDFFHIAVTEGTECRAAKYAQELWEYPRDFYWVFLSKARKAEHECMSHEIEAQVVGLLYDKDVSAWRKEDALSMLSYEYLSMDAGWTADKIEEKMKGYSDAAQAWVAKHIDKIRKAL